MFNKKFGTDEKMKKEYTPKIVAHKFASFEMFPYICSVVMNDRTY